MGSAVLNATKDNRLNATEVKVCKEGHKRISYECQACPLCAAVAFGKKMSLQKDRAVSEIGRLKGTISRMKNYGEE